MTTIHSGCSIHAHLDTQDTLAQQNVAHSAVNVVANGVTGADHVAVLELHGLGTGSAQLAGHNDLATLGAGLHDEAQHTVAGPGPSEKHNSQMRMLAGFWVLAWLIRKIDTSSINDCHS